MPDIKYSMILYLGFLLLWGSFKSGDSNNLANGFLIAGLYIVYDLLWTYLRDRAFYLPLSSVISGFILAVIGPVSSSLMVLVSLPLAAVISKQLIKIGARRHIFNPAGFALTVFSLGGYPVVSWWVPSLATDNLWLGLIILAGLVIIYRQNRWETALPFLIGYALFFNFKILDGTVLFFTSVMLIEPITSNFPGKKNKIIYGIIVALAAILFSALGQHLGELDPLLFALLLGNFIMSVVTLLI